MKKGALKVITIVGTRPEIIRLSCVISLFDKHLTHILVHTGQNYDYELNEIFFKELDIRRPNYFLDVDVSSLGRMFGETLIKIEPVLKEEKPDAILVLGDTNSSIAAIMAKRMKIRIYHMEAGNRCFDEIVPEEINRRIIDHISDYNLVYTEHSRRHLLAEGIPHRRIFLTGSPLFEVINSYKDQIESSTILTQLSLTSKHYFLVSTHREENVNRPEILSEILHFLNILAKKYSLPIIVSTHPRTRDQLRRKGKIHIDHRVQFLKPFGFYDYIQLQKNALCVISDSGTISEESAILSFPAITIRTAMERPEAMDAGTIILTGFDSRTVLDSIQLAICEYEKKPNLQIPSEYQIINTSWRVLKLILGTARLNSQRRL